MNEGQRNNSDVREREGERARARTNISENPLAATCDLFFSSLSVGVHRSTSTCSYPKMPTPKINAKMLVPRVPNCEMYVQISYIGW